VEADAGALVHPVHRHGPVFAWEIRGLLRSPPLRIRAGSIRGTRAARLAGPAIGTGGRRRPVTHRPVACLNARAAHSSRGAGAAALNIWLSLMGASRLPATYGRHACVSGVVEPEAGLPFAITIGPIDETPCVHGALRGCPLPLAAPTSRSTAKAVATSQRPMVIRPLRVLVPHTQSERAGRGSRFG
jgi:hypothetical protein